MNTTFIIGELKRELAEAEAAWEEVFNGHGVEAFEFTSITKEDPAVGVLLTEINDKSKGALLQCQQLNRLHSQLQSIKAFQSKLANLTQARV